MPAHRAAGLLPECLEGLGRQTLARDRFEVVVVDTGEDDARALVEAAGFTYLPDSRRGPAVKRNAGAAAGCGRYLAFLDADCVPESGWLEAGLAELERGGEVVQGRTLPPAGRPLSDFGHRLTVAGPSPLYESCNIFYSRERFEALDGFPEHLHDDLGEHFGEDALLGIRARRAGARIVFSAAATVRHRAFPPNLRRHLAERLRLRHFPYLLRQAPELRRALVGRVFLTAGQPLVWLALAGLAPALLWSPLWAASAAPYAVWLVLRLPRRARLRALRNAVLYLASDTLGALALLYGSIRHRRLVL